MCALLSAPPLGEGPEPEGSVGISSKGVLLTGGATSRTRNGHGIFPQLKPHTIMSYSRRCDQYLINI